MKKPFHAVHLRCFALVFMVLDHLWITVVPGNFWMTCVGRLAFPIFAFQAAEGYRHTADFKGYLRRLLLFAVISEIPLNLMGYGSWFYPFHQNVLFTMVLGLLAVDAWERGRSRLLSLAAVLGLGLAGAVLCVDYGMTGVLTVAAFGILRRSRLGQLAVMVVLHILCAEGQVLGDWFPVQGFAVLSLVFIWLYNGEKGPRSRFVQLSGYWFYPLHMLLFWGLRELAL